MRLGLTKNGLCDRAGLSRNTVLSATRGDGVFPHSALRIAQALEYEDASELVLTQPSEGVATEVSGTQSRRRVAGQGVPGRLAQGVKRIAVSRVPPASRVC